MGYYDAKQLAISFMPVFLSFVCSSVSGDSDMKMLFCGRKEV